MRTDPSALLTAAASFRGGAFGVAFSGGGDSTALLLEALQWARPRHMRLHAIVVDHAARPGSADEAAEAAARAERWGARAEVLRLPVSGRRFSQARARAARARALAERCAAAGIATLAVGHTADDQAETVLMRAGRQPLTMRGLAGLAPLGPSPAWPQGRDLLIVRPLLGVRRRALRAVLEAQGAPWFEDPSNRDPRFERVRARAALAAFERAGGRVESLLAAADTARRVETALRAEAWALTQAALRMADGADAGRWRLDPATFAAGRPPARRRCLEALLQAVAGRPRPVARDALTRLEAAVSAPGFSGATLAGVRLSRARGALMLERDPGALTGRGGGAGLAPLALARGETSVWDGRWLLGPVPAAGLARADGPGAPAFWDRAGVRRAPRARDLRPGLLARMLQPERPELWCSARGATGETVLSAWRADPCGPH